MTRSARALRAAIRNQEEAARLYAAAARAEELSGPGLAGELRAQAARYEQTAAEWLRIAAAEAEPRVEAHECCPAPVEEPCHPECGCGDCESQRALDEDADAAVDRWS